MQMSGFHCRKFAHTRGEKKLIIFVANKGCSFARQLQIWPFPLSSWLGSKSVLFIPWIGVLLSFHTLGRKIFVLETRRGYNAQRPLSDIRVPGRALCLPHSGAPGGQRHGLYTVIQIHLTTSGRLEAHK